MVTKNKFYQTIVDRIRLLLLKHASFVLKNSQSDVGFSFVLTVIDVKKNVLIVITASQSTSAFLPFSVIDRADNNFDLCQLISTIDLYGCMLCYISNTFFFAPSLYFILHSFEHSVLCFNLHLFKHSVYILTYTYLNIQFIF